MLVDKIASKANEGRRYSYEKKQQERKLRMTLKTKVRPACKS